MSTILRIIWRTILLILCLPLGMLILVFWYQRRYNTLVVEISDKILEERPSYGRLGFILGKKPRGTVLSDLLSLFLTARRSKKVKLVVIKLKNVSIGFAAAQSIYRAIKKLKEHGKRVAIFLDGAENLQYLASAGASHLLAPPVGQLGLKGLRVELIFLKNLLDKIGVEAEFEQVGAFKTAAEIFTRDEPSPEGKQMMESLFDDLYRQLIAAISDGRAVSEEDVSNIIDQGPYTHKRALEAGLLDKLLYEDELEDWMEEQLEGKPKTITPDKLLGQRRLQQTITRWFKAPELIGIVHVSGIISSSDQGGSSAVNMCEPEKIANSIERMTKEKAIKGIILRINSPGGTEVGSDKIWRAVSKAKEEKPVVASMSNTAASGGYYVAMGANKVLAESGTITGSIGVLGGKFRIEKLAERLGAKTESMDKGKHAGMGSPIRPFTDEERVLLKKDLDDFYETFLDRVQTGRGKQRAEIEPHAQGRVWTGKQALDRGLVDLEGSFEEATEAVKELAGIPEERQLDVIAVKGKARLPISIPTQLGLRTMVPFGNDQTDLITGLSTLATSFGRDVKLLAILPWQIQIS